MLINNIIRVFICLLLLSDIPDSATLHQNRQIIAEAATSYHSFHSINVNAKVFAEPDESVLLEHEDGDLYIRILFSDNSRRSAVQSDLQIKLWEDVNYPKAPENWVEKFSKTISDGTDRAVN